MAAATLSVSSMAIDVDASFTGDGALKTISFPREDSSWQWNWNYFYDPGDTVAKTFAKEPKMGSPTYIKINDNWWLMTAVDD